MDGLDYLYLGMNIKLIYADSNWHHVDTGDAGKISRPLTSLQVASRAPAAALVSVIRLLRGVDR